MPRRPRALKDVRASRPAKPYRADGTLHPKEWEIACSAAGVLALVVLAGEPWFVAARPLELPGKGVHLQVLVRWLSAEVWQRVPAAVDGYDVEVVVEGEATETRTLQ